MKESNLGRMIRLADQFFEAKNDPLQLSIDEVTTARLKQIHPNTMSELSNKKGPIAWVLVIPTTHDLMEQFIAKKIHEKDLLSLTPLNASYDSLYLCSALVLPEHRGKGLAKRLVSRAIRAIKRQHPITYLFYWAFSKEGKSLANSIAKKFNLPLRNRPD